MTGRAPSPRNGKAPAASEMPGIPGDASRYAGISVLSAAGKIPPDHTARLIITSLGSQPGPDAQRRAEICPARCGGAWCQASRHAILGTIEGLHHGSCPACRRLLR